LNIGLTFKFHDLLSMCVHCDALLNQVTMSYMQP